MLTNDLKHIILMNPVRTGLSYNKYKNKTDAVKDIMLTRDFDDYMKAWSSGNHSRGGMWDGVNFLVKREIKNPIIRNFVEFYIKLRVSLFHKGAEVETTFENVKESFHTMTAGQFKDDEEFNTIIKKLDTTAQNSALATVMQAKLLNAAEKTLVDNGFIQYQTEESLIKFIRQSKKGLCLSELEWFNKIIPDDVVEKFKKAEDLAVFDNYFVLHYDPTEAKNIYYTSEPKPKDPILFGAIVGSNKLYFIADWIDEYCNLTYADILEKNIDYKL